MLEALIFINRKKILFCLKPCFRESFKGCTAFICIRSLLRLYLSTWSCIYSVWRHLLEANPHNPICLWLNIQLQIYAAISWKFSCSMYDQSVAKSRSFKISIILSQQISFPSYSPYLQVNTWPKGHCSKIISHFYFPLRGALPLPIHKGRAKSQCGRVSRNVWHKPPCRVSNIAIAASSLLRFKTCYRKLNIERQPVVDFQCYVWPRRYIIWLKKFIKFSLISWRLLSQCKIP